jgi:hypothetical protein
MSCPEYIHWRYSCSFLLLLRAYHGYQNSPKYIILRKKIFSKAIKSKWDRLISSEQKLVNRVNNLLTRKICVAWDWKFILCGRKVFCCAFFAHSTWNKHTVARSHLSACYIENYCLNFD